MYFYSHIISNFSKIHFIVVSFLEPLLSKIISIAKQVDICLFVI